MYVWLHLHVTSLDIYSHRNEDGYQGHVRGLIIKTAVTFSVGLATPVNVSFFVESPSIKTLKHSLLA